jgi:gas vesicle protein
VTYILTTRSIRKQLANTFQDVGDAVDEGVHEVKERAEDAAESVSDAARKAASKIRE